MAHCCEHQDGRAEIIANSEGSRTTASCVAFTETERLIGAPAQNQAASNPTNTVFVVKRYVPPPPPLCLQFTLPRCFNVTIQLTDRTGCDHSSSLLPFLVAV